MQSALGIW